jgi:hypothetical protein
MPELSRREPAALSCTAPPGVPEPGPPLPAQAASVQLQTIVAAKLEGFKRIG